MQAIHCALPATDIEGGPVSVPRLIDIFHALILCQMQDTSGHVATLYITFDAYLKSSVTLASIFCAEQSLSTTDYAVEWVDGIS